LRLVRFLTEGGARSGFLDDDHVIDISGSLAVCDDTVELINLVMGPGVPAAPIDGTKVLLSDATLLAPLRPRKNIFAIGKNFIEHVRELPGADTVAQPPPEFPIVFSKPPTSVIGPGGRTSTPATIQPRPRITRASWRW